MSSLADAPDLVGFFSYSREDDEDSGGKLSRLRERIQAELRLQLGRTRKDFRLWQDKVAIAHGELWEDTIKKGISESVFFIPIITPTAVRSSYCKFEFESFLARERELDRNNLIFPILYVPVPALTDERWRQDPLLSIVGSRQYEDWQNLRHLDASSSEVVALRVEKFCANICRALEQEWLSLQERQQAEARRLAEGERRRQQEAEIKQRADEEERRRKAEAEERRRDEEERRQQEAEDRRRLAEAEAQKRGQDEELRKLEKEAKRVAKEELRRKRLEQEPQQLTKPWLLPLIGAGATFTSMLLYLEFRTPLLFYWYWFILLIPHALYGGTAGMLVQRFGIPQAIAFPVVPAIFLYFVLIIAFYLIYGVNIEYLFTWRNIVNILLGFVFSVVSAGLAFWLHSLWARKRRLRDAGMVP
jgi:hypothetical protein